MGCDEPVAGGCGVRSAGADCRGHDGMGVRLLGRGEQMGMGFVDGGGSSIEAGVSGVQADVQISMVRCVNFFYSHINVSAGICTVRC